jgi:hypothetical protein
MEAMMNERMNNNSHEQHDWEVADILAMNAGMNTSGETDWVSRPAWRDDLAAENLTMAELFEAIAAERGVRDAPGRRLVEEAMLLYFVPLVRVAWSEGRITRRERMLITEVARLHGIEEGTLADARLQGWLNFEPTPEFYDNSFASLRGLLALLPHEKSQASRRDLLSLCTRVAEASGGEREFVAGGSRICPEEVASIKRVTAELHSEEVNKAEARERAVQRLALRDALGIADEILLSELETHGITAQTARAVNLFPLVQMAWAEGNVTRRERSIITSAARLRGIRPGSPAYDMLNRWLDRRPSDEFFDVCLRAVRATFAMLPPEMREVDEWDLLTHCTQVAAASSLNADFTDRSSRVCDEELKLLDMLSTRLRGAHTTAPTTAPTTL